MYTPKPIDTRDVVLSDDIMQLSEYISKNTHEVWASNRISDGWTYGKERNDEKKTHPCLVPYEELSETEKDYDRGTSLQVLKLILKLGYRIVKAEGDEK